jgi:hypothetical protein
MNNENYREVQSQDTQQQQKAQMRQFSTPEQHQFQIQNMMARHQPSTSPKPSHYKLQLQSQKGLL